MAEQSAGSSRSGQRRDARRRATYEVLIGHARNALRQGRPLSLRAIAAEMGMTAPALYRYVDSHAALQAALAEDVFDEVCQAMADSAERYPDLDCWARMIASVVAFRRWALERPEEYRLVVGQPAELDGPAPSYSLRFATYFVRCVQVLYEQGELREPAPAEIPAGVAEELQARLDTWDGVSLPDLPVAVWWSCVRNWVMLNGVITMEVDGRVDAAFVRGAGIFRDALRSCGAHLGLRDDASGRLARVLDEELEYDGDDLTAVG